MVKSFEETSRSFTWCGEGHVKNRRKSYQLHYESFIHEGVTIRIKDYVLIRNDDYSNSECLSNCYIAQVEDLFDAGDDREDRYRAVVQWFMHIDELLPKVQKALQEPDYKRELVKNTSKRFGNIIDAETIFGKCSVINLPHNVPPYMLWDTFDSHGLPLFCCRWEYDGQNLFPVKDRNHDSNHMTKLRENSAPKNRSKNVIVSELESSDDEQLSEQACYITPNHRKELSSLSKVGVCSTSRTSPKLESTRLTRASSKSKRKDESRTDLIHKNKVARNLVGSFNEDRKNKILEDNDEEEFDFESTKHLRNSTQRRLINDMREKPKPRKRIIFDDDLPQTRDETIGTEGIARRTRAIKSSGKRHNKRDISPDYSDNDDEYIPKHSSDSSSSDEDPSYSEKEDYRLSPQKKSKVSRQRSRRKSQSKATPNRTPSTKRTPGSKKLTEIKPIPIRTIPRTTLTPLAEARARLHVSAVPDRLPCREQEFEHVYSFVKGKLEDGTGGCMYISGVPGTGKTATVRNVIHALELARDEDDEVDFKFIEINGMKFTDPHQCYVHLVKELIGEKISSTVQAENILDKEFSTGHKGKRPVVLLVDELDLLCTSKQKVLYNLFDWPTRPHSKLIVLAIANTMNLLERVMMNRISSRLGLTRVTFVPYNHKQLQEIIMSRLEGLKAFDPDAVLLVARKVAAPLSGDVRRALNICRRAAEIAEQEESSPSKKKTCLVTMAHIEKALDEILGSLHIKRIQCASKHEKLFLRAILADFREKGLEETTFSCAFRQHHTLCRIEGILPLNTTEVASIYNRLSNCGLVSANSGARSDFRKVYLRVNIDDVNYALNSSY